MRKLKDEKLFKLLRDYLIIYLPEQKCCSKNTIKSYRESLNILLDFLVEEKEILLEDITFSLLDHQMISEFLEWLEKERNCCISTRNQRLSCIRSFFKYARNMDPVLIAHWNDLQKIPLKKDMKSKVIEFMSEEALKAVLAQPDTKTRKGIRDLFFLILMYDTAARIREILDIKVKDFSVNSKTPCVYLTGKGTKKRVVPLMQKTVDHFHNYLDIFHNRLEGYDPNQYLFYTTRHGSNQQMSDDNVARFMNKYGQNAKKIVKMFL